MKDTDRHYSGMTIRNGKFYKGENPVPLEFGNWTQIILMQSVLRKHSALTGKGLEVQVSHERSITGSIYFHCVCGQAIYNTEDVDEEGDLEPLEGVVSCPKCKKDYDIFEEDEKLFAKFKRYT